MQNFLNYSNLIHLAKSRGAEMRGSRGDKTEQTCVVTSSPQHNFCHPPAGGHQDYNAL